jgi:cob(I)alamin adenosyltransferase
MMPNAGRVQIYTGDGKGKTTAALGLALRACGAGRRVYVMQFLKGRRTSEVAILRQRFPEMRVAQCGRACFVRGRPAPADRAAARRAFAKLRRETLSGRYDLVIADELVVAVALKLVAAADVLRLIEDRPPAVELVLTGRGATRSLIARADLVTDMRCVKHYFQRGVRARRGIEL